MESDHVSLITYTHRFSTIIKQLRWFLMDQILALILGCLTYTAKNSISYQEKGKAQIPLESIKHAKMRKQRKSRYFSPRKSQGNCCITHFKTPVFALNTQKAHCFGTKREPLCKTN